MGVPRITKILGPHPYLGKSINFTQCRVYSMSIPEYPKEQKKHVIQTSSRQTFLLFLPQLWKWKMVLFER